MRFGQVVAAENSAAPGLYRVVRILFCDARRLDLTVYAAPLCAESPRKCALGLFIVASSQVAGSDLRRGTRARSGSDDVVFGAESEFGDVLRPVIVHDKDVVLSIASSAWLPVENCNHRLHRDHHARLENGVDVLT